MKKKTDHIITLGRFGAPHGVLGWLRLNSYTSPGENIIDITPWLIKEKNVWQPLSIESSRCNAQQILIKIKNSDDRDAAKRYTNCYIGTKRENLPNAGPDEYYWADLEGLSVITTSGQSLGNVFRILETGANDVFIIKGDTEIAIPYIDDVVLNIDLDKQQMLVEWDFE